MIMTQTTTSRAGIMKLWLLNFVANAVLLAAGYFCAADSRRARLAGGGIGPACGTDDLLRGLAARWDSGIFPRV